MLIDYYNKLKETLHSDMDTYLRKDLTPDARPAKLLKETMALLHDCYSKIEELESKDQPDLSPQALKKIQEIIDEDLAKNQT